MRTNATTMDLSAGRGRSPPREGPSQWQAYAIENGRPQSEVASGAEFTAYDSQGNAHQKTRPPSTVASDDSFASSLPKPQTAKEVVRFFICIQTARFQLILLCRGTKHRGLQDPKDLVQRCHGPHRMVYPRTLRSLRGDVSRNANVQNRYIGGRTVDSDDEDSDDSFGTI